LQRNGQVQTTEKAYFDAKSGRVNNSLAFLFKEINVLKRHLKPEKTASSKKRKAESILFSLCSNQFKNYY
jgi:ribosomal protein S15P/S13E